jgi:arylsulfatase A-like enzyme
MDRPNILLIMTDEERYPPPYETDTLRAFRKSRLTARESLRSSGLEFHRHYAGSTACLPSRATLFTGQYPSLHGASQTDAMAKKITDPAMSWLDPDQVPTLGDWFRAGGYESHYRGKWHISHPDLFIPGTHEGLMASDDHGITIPEAIEAYRRADRLDPFGFSGWIGREPHGASKADCGAIRDGVFAEQVVDLFKNIAANQNQGPWLAVASFVNPHDISFSGWAWENLLGLAGPDTTVPSLPAPPSQGDSFEGRPKCQELWKETWIKMTYEQSPDDAYRRLYYHLHVLVDAAIARIMEALNDNGLADDTIVVFTSDHGDLVGSHGGMMQKWYNAYDESIRVPLYVTGPGVVRNSEGVSLPTSHVDIIPTLMGLAGIDVERAAEGVAAHHAEVQPLPGRDLSGIITGTVSPESLASPLYFLTEDDFSRGISGVNMFSGEPYDAVDNPSKVEAVIAMLPTGSDGPDQLWKLNHYYERLDEWNEEHGIPKNPFARPPAEPFYELHNLTVDPEERRNWVSDEPDVLMKMVSVLDRQRDSKRKTPSLLNTHT